MRIECAQAGTPNLRPLSEDGKKRRKTSSKKVKHSTLLFFWGRACGGGGSSVKCEIEVWSFDPGNPRVKLILCACRGWAPEE